MSLATASGETEKAPACELLDLRLSSPELSPREARREIWTLATTFGLLFLGTGAFQQFLGQALGGTEQARLLRSVVLAVLYGSFLLWRIGVAWTVRWLGEWRSILLGALSYTILPTLILLRSPTWLLLTGAATMGWGAASLWLASGTRVLLLSSRPFENGPLRGSHYGRGTATIYMGTISGLALGLVVQSLLAAWWGIEATVLWAAGLSLAGAALATTLWRGGTPQEKPSWPAYRSLLFDPHILTSGVMLFASALTYPVLLSSFGDEVVSQGSVRTLGLVTVWFHVAHAILSYVAGRASDHWGRGRTLAAGFLGGATGLVLASLLQRTSGLSVAAFCLGIPSGMVPVVATALVGDKVRGPRRTMALGSLFIWRDAAVVAGLVTGELLRRTLALRGSYLVLACVLVVFAAASWRLGGRGGHVSTSTDSANPAARSGA